MLQAERGTPEGVALWLLSQTGLRGEEIVRLTWDEEGYYNGGAVAFIIYNNAATKALSRNSTIVTYMAGTTALNGAYDSISTMVPHATKMAWAAGERPAETFTLYSSETGSSRDYYWLNVVGTYHGSPVSVTGASTAFGVAPSSMNRFWLPSPRYIPVLTVAFAAAAAASARPIPRSGRGFRRSFPL